MQLYAGSTSQFLNDAVQHKIASKLSDAYTGYFRFRVAASEFASWQNSLTALATQIRYANLLQHGIILEMQLPLTSSRLDALITGRDESGAPNAVLVELKQWTDVQPSDLTDCVITFLGRKLRTLPHPSVQADHYRQYLVDTHSAFQENGGIALHSCSWLHNLDSKMSPVFDKKFGELLRKCPLFAGIDADEFASYLNQHIGAGDNAALLRPIAESKYRASKKLLNHVAEVIEKETEYTLLDDQIVAFNEIVDYAAASSEVDQRVVVIIGGPGTGKSVIALRALGTLSRRGLNAHYVTGSKAFTENLRKAVGRRAGVQFRYTHNYMDVVPGEVDVLIVDEAHRIRETSNSRFTPAHKRSSTPQIEELMRAARASVFFVDDYQVVRPGEVGSAALIREIAGSLGYSYREIELKTQFRCNGSDNYPQWLDETLGITEPLGTRLDRTAMDFQIVDSAEDLEAKVKAAVANGYTARMAAGFCWKWSDPLPDGTLVDDVVIGKFRRPWDAKPGAGRLAKGIPSASFWATDPNGLAQIGCVYNAQGFEFDYVGVIFGSDMVFDEDTETWKGQPSASFDKTVKRSKGAFLKYVANTYRVLMTRGLRGCFVYFIDDATRRHFEQCMVSDFEH